jgi:tRNA (uracil-5-)-methyltransferase TRM9
MDEETVAQLNGINQEFYQTFAQSFSQTRGRIQSGVRCVLQKIPLRGNFLDIGCGNGNLARTWAEKDFLGTFTGVDFSDGLIDAARKNVRPMSTDQSINFLNVDLSSECWVTVLPDLHWDAIFCFAVLHHIPSADQRLRVCQQIHALAAAETDIWISVWQLHNSSRLKKRILNWELVGVDQDHLENGDVLMDWRAHERAADTPAYRYVHVFEEAELNHLAQYAGFTISETFYSDGKEGNLGLYQRWVLDN